MHDEPSTDEPDISVPASLLGDRTRARMLAALMDGRARTATELAVEGGVGAPAASAHLARLVAAGILEVVAQGRHRYHRIADPGVAGTIEALMHLAPVNTRRFGPSDPALRFARVCYDHLAGELGVALADTIVGRGLVHGSGDRAGLTPAGEAWLRNIGAPLDRAAKRRPACRFCMDWSERRPHLAGAVGAILLEWMLGRRLLTRIEASRALVVHPGAQRFAFGLEPPP